MKSCRLDVNTERTPAHEVSAAREPIGIAEKRLQFEIFEKIFEEIFEKCEFDLISPFLERKIFEKCLFF